MKSRFKYENDLLQENVEVLRDENELYRNTMEILTHELEKNNRVNTAVCDLYKKNCREVQSNSQITITFTICPFSHKECGMDKPL